MMLETIVIVKATVCEKPLVFAREICALSVRKNTNTNSLPWQSLGQCYFVNDSTDCDPPGAPIGVCP